jgi:hypothetical protein
MQCFSLRRNIPVTSRKELCHTINILFANTFMHFWTERYKEINKEIIKERRKVWTKGHF